MKKQAFWVLVLLVTATVFLLIFSCDIFSDNDLATVSTLKVTEVTQVSVVCGGDIISEGGAMLISRGVCWSTESAPTTEDNSIAIMPDSGSFEIKIRALKPNTTYYIRAFAINSYGTGYGKTIRFKTKSTASDSFTDPRDGTVYKTVQIADQTWMAENLKYLPSVVGPAEGSYTDPCYYLYNYYGTDVPAAKAAANYQTRGVLYNWPAALEAIPPGWHLPTEAEWEELIDYLGGTAVAGRKLKEAGDEHWYESDSSTTNEIDFSAIPSGFRSERGIFENERLFAYFWSATETNIKHANNFNIYSHEGYMNSEWQNKELGASIRCVKDLGTAYNLSLQISPSEAGTVSGSGNYAEGSVRRITATAVKGYVFVDWTGDTENISSTTSPIATIRIPGQDINLTANFREDIDGTFKDSRDGTVYRIIKIGDQVWMAENLKYLPGVDSSRTSSNTRPCYYVYGYNGTDVSVAKAAANYENYGVLYNWEAAKTAAPAGWHLPTDEEWTQLTDYLGAESVAGGKLKEIGTSHWRSPNTDATNSSGFTALAGGNRRGNGKFYHIKDYAYWWSASENSATDAWYRYITYGGARVNRGNYNKENGLSVRCVKDD